jgi:hypothetical protein
MTVYMFGVDVGIIPCGTNGTIRKTLGGPRGDLALIQRCLLLLSEIAINTYHMWATTDFENTHIINDDALPCHPPGLRSIIRSLQDPTTAEYVQVRRVGSILGYEILTNSTSDRNVQ